MKKYGRTCLSCVVILLGLAGLQVHAQPVPEVIDFNEHIRPILSDRCFFCHGPDDNDRKADLRLDQPDDLFKDRGGYHVIKPGDAEASELYYLITAEDEDERMPPKKSKLPEISKRDQAIIKKWIEQGAKWDVHWAYREIKNPKVPETKNAKWGKNAIDQFILARLEKEKWAPSKRADRVTLIRRVTFDLTGLPPTPKEIDAFLADESEGAYERLVDRLLATKAYGERMASEWMDVARYSDTYGYQVDRDRFVWPWRDWVIKSFNENLPYDDFIRYQLAGDLLPNATDEQILATTFNRLHPQKVEGGSVEEEFRVEYVADRTHTFGTAFLGLTLECARCHTHKYDPITHTEYYQFFSFFNNIDEAGLYSYFTNSIPTPTLKMTNDKQKEQLKKLREQIAVYEKEMGTYASKKSEGFEEWLKNQEKSLEVQGMVKHLDFEAYKHNNNKTIDGVKGKGVKLTGDDAIGVGVGNFNRAQAFSVSLYMNTPDVKERAVVYHRSRAWTDAASRGYELLIEDGKLSAALIHFYPGNAIRVITKDVIPTNKWVHVSVVYDGSSSAKGLTIYVNGEPVATEIVKDKLTKNITGGGGDNIAIGERFRDKGFKNGMVDEFKVFNRELTGIEIAGLVDESRLKALGGKAADKLSKDEVEQLRWYYLHNVDETYKKMLGELQKRRTALNNTLNGLREIMVMRELPEPRQAYLLDRGMYNARKAKVEADTPAFLPSMPNDAPKNRLGLAEWLTNDKQPLTARVTVNRYWQLVFGQGLVRTPEDFGSQGQQPSHPQLLDWLSYDFMKNGWDVKRLMKQMVMSATYQQSSSLTKRHLEQDPENILLARSHSYRLSAEMLRDNSLKVSGRLVDKVGGGSVRPYEIEQSFKPAGRTKGEGLYRRSLYTYWKRTGPAPVMMALDASKRDVCRVKRERTASPIQAFVMLNGPQFVEASRGLAERLMKEHAGDTDKVLGDMFRWLTSRKPNDKELALLKKLHASQVEHFTKQPEQAKQYLNVGDAKADGKLDVVQLASYTTVANMLLNHDECVMKR